jgi:hypothetical protein
VFHPRVTTYESGEVVAFWVFSEIKEQIDLSIDRGVLGSIGMEVDECPFSGNLMAPADALKAWLGLNNRSKEKRDALSQVILAHEKTRAVVPMQSNDEIERLKTEVAEAELRVEEMEQAVEKLTHERDEALAMRQALEDELEVMRAEVSVLKRGAPKRSALDALGLPSPATPPPVDLARATNVRLTRWVNGNTEGTDEDYRQAWLVLDMQLELRGVGRIAATRTRMRNQGKSVSYVDVIRHLDIAEPVYAVACHLYPLGGEQ